MDTLSLKRAFSMPAAGTVFKKIIIAPAIAFVKFKNLKFTLLRKIYENLLKFSTNLRKTGKRQ